MFCAVFFSFAHSGVGVSYTCTKISEGFVASGADTSLFVPWKKDVASSVTVRAALPAMAGRLMLAAARRRQERLFFDALIRSRDPRRLAYLWPSASIELVRELASRRIPMVREMINCHVGTSKRILDSAFGARGLGSGPITRADVDYEDEVLRLVDHVVAPGPGVVDSLLENGVSPAKIIHSTYGWEPGRVSPAESSAADGLTYLFVGTSCVRKGVDTLVHAWRMADVPGRLVLLGGVDPEMTDFVAANATGSVIHLPFSRSVAAQYRAASVFVMPSLEEGGPLVTYEALGAGLPVIATRMGGGYALEHDGPSGGNGLLIAEGDREALAAAIRTMATDNVGRARMAARSAAMAERFTWDKVARRRADEIIASVFA